MSKPKIDPRDFSEDSYNLGESAGKQLGVIMGFSFAVFLFAVYLFFQL